MPYNEFPSPSTTETEKGERWAWKSLLIYEENQHWGGSTAGPLTKLGSIHKLLSSRFPVANLSYCVEVDELSTSLET